MAEAQVSPADWGATPVDGPSAWGAAPVDTGTSTTMDVLKSIPSGLAKGVAYTAGMGGDLANLAQKGVNFVRGQLPNVDLPNTAVGDWLRAESAKTANLPVAQVGHGDLPGSYVPPTSEQVRGTIEKATGPLYEPQTTPGKYTDTAASFVPAALAGEGGLIPRAAQVVKQAIIPGLASEGAGQAFEGTPLEPWARAGAAIVTGGAAHLASRPSTAEGAIARALPGGIDQSTVNQAESLIQEAQARGISLTWPEALSQVAGKPVLSDAMRIAESSPQSRDITQEFFSQRPAQVKQAASQEFSNIGTQPQNPSYLGTQVAGVATDTINDVRAAINKATRPSYDSAGQTLVPRDVHAAMIADPLFQQALDRVRNDPAKNSFVRSQSDRSVAVYDAVAKELEERAQNASSPTNPDKSQAVASATGSLGGDTKKIAIAADKAANGGVSEYENALNTQTKLRDKYLNPLISGPLGKIADAPTTKAAIDALFPTNPLPNSQAEVSTAVGAMAKRNPIATAQLVRAHAESVFNDAVQQLQGGENQMGAAKFASTIAGNPQQRANLQAAVEALPDGKQRWAGFERFLEIAEATGTRQPKGSLTAFNERELSRKSTGGVVATAAKHALSPGEWWSLAHDAIGKWQLGNNLKSLATILTDPRSGKLLNKLVDTKVGGSQAGAIVGRLIAQANIASKGNVGSSDSNK